MATPPTLAGTYTIPGSTLLESNSQPLALANKGSETQPLQEHQDVDAFSRYSNDVVRMKALLLLPEDESEDDALDAVAKINEAFRSVGLSDLTITSKNNGNPSKRRKDNSTKPVAVDQQGSVRKTRLSYEVHPSLLLHDEMREIEALENSHYIEEGGSSLSNIASLFSLNANVWDMLVENEDEEEK